MSNIEQLWSANDVCLPDARTRTFDPRSIYLPTHVAGVRPNDPAPIIPIDHETLLTRVCYVVSLQGRLRMTSLGRLRLTSIEAAPSKNTAQAGGGMPTPDGWPCYQHE